MDTQTPNPETQKNQNFVFPSAPELFKQAWAIYKQKFNTFVSISLLPLAVILICGIAFGAVAPFQNNTLNFHAMTPAMWLFLLAIILVAIFLSMWSFAATIYCAANPQSAETASSYQQSADDVPHLIVAGILSGLAVLGGTILLVVPGIIFAFWYSQTAYVVVIDKLHGRAALRQSKIYVKGNVGEIFKKGLCIIILTIALAIAVTLIFGVFSSLFNETLIVDLANVTFRLLWTPVATIYLFLLFQQLKASKQSENTNSHPQS